MKKVILESPYAGDIPRNVLYARCCVKHSLSLGEAPLASHLLYTQEGILNDEDINERMLGIIAGLSWLQYSELQVFYIDFGISNGMSHADARGRILGIPFQTRNLPKDFAKPLIDKGHGAPWK